MTAADACVAADAGADVVLAPVESLVDAVRVGDVLTTHGDVFHFPGGNGLFRLIESDSADDADRNVERGVELGGVLYVDAVINICAGEE